MTSISRVEQGRWKFVSRASTTRKLGRRVEEDPRPSLAGDHRPGVPAGDAFQHPHGGGAHGDDPPARRPRFGDGRGGGFADGVAFLVHDVVCELLRLHRCKRPQPDVEGEERALDAGGLQRGQQPRREMQPGGGRGEGAGRLGIHGLVTLVIGAQVTAGRAADVGRQGCFAQPRQLVQEVLRALEPQPAMPLLVHCQDRRGDPGRRASAVEQDDRSARLGAAAGLEQGPPVVRRNFLGQQDFEAAAALRIPSPQAGGNHAGVVEHQQVARAQPAREIRKGLVRQRAGSAVEHQEP
jgi:hypothetical protein